MRNAFCGSLCSAVLIIAYGIAITAKAMDVHAKFVDPGSSESNMTALTEFSQIKHMMRADDEIFLLYFYDSADVNSLRVAPLIEEAAGGLEGFVTTMAVNVRDPKVQWLVNAWTVQLLPSLKVVSPIKTHRNSGVPKGVGGIKQPIDYKENSYLPEHVRKFALQVLPSKLIQKINDEHGEALSEAAHTGENSFCILFTDKAISSQLYRALALRFNRRMAFVEVYKQKSPNLMKQLGVKKVPTLMVFPSKRACEKKGCTVGKSVLYDGRLQVTSLIDFLLPYEQMSRIDLMHQSEEEEQAILAKEERRATTPVLTIASQSDWNDEVLKASGIVGLLFADSTTTEAKEKMQALADAKSRVARSAVTGYVMVDSTKNQKLVKFFCGTDANPSMQPELVFVSAKKSVYTRFVGALSGDGVINFISNQLRSGTGVKKFDANSLPQWQD